MEHQIGICFSGGGARGAAHVGVLQALLEHDIYPTIISGTSAGAIVGAMYAAGCSIADMMDLAQGSSVFKLYNVGFPSQGLTNLRYLRKKLTQFIPQDSFDALKFPLYLTMTNLETGQLVIRSQGKLHEVVEASCSVPLIFKPVEIDGQLYVDGGIMSNLPARPIADKAQFLIGVNVMPAIPVDQASINSWRSIAARCLDLTLHTNSRLESPLCHFEFEPNQVADYSIWHLNKTKELYEIGYNYALSQIPALKEKMLARQVGLN